MCTIVLKKFAHYSKRHKGNVIIMSNNKTQCHCHINTLNIRGYFNRCRYPAKYVTPDFNPVCGLHKLHIDKMEKLFKKPLCKPLSCEKTGISKHCNNSDLKVVQLKSAVNEYNGNKVLMCKECRKANNGGFKIIKTRYI